MKNRVLSRAIRHLKYRRFFTVFTTFSDLVVIQLILGIKTEAVYQMKDIVHGYLLIMLIFEIIPEKVEKSVFENSSF